MSRVRVPICVRDPIGLSLSDAAAYIGVSDGTFAKAVEEGLMPKPVELFSRKLYLATEIDAALKRLPRKGEPAIVSDGPDWGSVSA